MKSTKHLLFIRSMLLTFSSFLIAAPAFADSNPGKKLGTWLTDNVGGAIPGAIMLIGLYFIFTRDWMKMISFVGIALVVGMLMNWENVKTFAGGLFDALFT